MPTVFTVTTVHCAQSRFESPRAGAMATRGNVRREPVDFVEHEASTLLPRTDPGAQTRRAASASVSSRLRLAALVLVAVIGVRLLLLSQNLNNRDGLRTEDSVQFNGSAAESIYEETTVEEALNQYEGEATTFSLDSELESDTPVPTEPPSSSPAVVSTPETVATAETVDVRDACYYERDFGLIENASTPAYVFCAKTGMDTSTTGEPSLKNRTKVTLVDAPSGIHAVVFKDLLLDMTAAQPFRDIASLAQDGGDHDPRFQFTDDMIYCGCEELQQYTDVYRAAKYKQYPVWGDTLAYRSAWDKRDASLVCSGPNVARPPHLLDGTNDTLLEFPGRVLLIARRDDHNPFFQVSNALNAWIMLRALKWDPKDLTLIHLDAGYPSPVDTLHQKLLAPSTTVLTGHQLMGKRLLFSGEAMLAPFETSGPMMQHLDDTEPCFASELFRTFRSEALHVMGVKGMQAPASSRKEFTVTFISRKPYAGRVVQRRWINEDEVVARLRAEYPAFDGRAIVFRSIDFVDLTLQTQMQLMVESDVVVSMHGAGLVNVMWARPGTLVVEIFPKPRRRWGYRNLCQFLGCDWHEFRGGEDIRTGTDGHPNANDKVIPYEEWKAFFDPLFQRQLSKTTPTVGGTREVSSLSHEWLAVDEVASPVADMLADEPLPNQR